MSTVGATPPPDHGSVGVDTRAALPVNLDHIREFAARINAKLTVDDVLQNVADILREEFKASRTVIVLGDAAERNPPIAASSGVEDVFMAGWPELGIGFALTGLAVLRNRVHVLGDVDSDSMLANEQRAWLREHSVRSSWAVPLPAKSGEPAGAIALLYPILHRPSANNVLLSQLYAQHAAMALDNARLHDALRVQAIRDSKTGLFTHDYLLDSISRELGRAAREGDSTALVMIDVDDYKQFNDTYGHVAGDKVLADLATIIMATVRTSDTPARFGGEEFSILLPGTSHEEAMVIAERIRQSIADHEAELKPGFHARVTVSVGVAVHTGPSTNPDTILEAADSALYDSKRSGKDTVRLAPMLAVAE